MECERMNKPVLAAYESMLLEASKKAAVMTKGEAKKGKPANPKSGGKAKQGNPVQPKGVKKGVQGKPKFPTAKKMVAMKEETEELGETVTLTSLCAKYAEEGIECSAVIAKLDEILTDKEILDDIVNVLIARMDEVPGEEASEEESEETQAEEDMEEVEAESEEEEEEEEEKED
jgi:hypothetical protein